MSSRAFKGIELFPDHLPESDLENTLSNTTHLIICKIVPTFVIVSFVLSSLVCILADFSGIVTNN